LYLAYPRHLNRGVKKDFYIYKCLREIHRLCQEELLDKHYGEILLILNTPGSLEHFMVHTDPDKIRFIFNRILEHIMRYARRGSIEFGYKLGKEDQLSFYVYEPSGMSTESVHSGKKPEAEATLLSEIDEVLSGLGGRAWTERSITGDKAFRFTLDIIPPGHRRNEDTNKPQPISYPDWKRKTILVVDDVRTNLLLLEGFLIPTKARVISVNNGLKAVNAVKKDPSINFVLMDVRMPVLDGYEATRRIKRIKPWLPVVAISAYPGSAESEKWKQAGCDAFLGKPLNSSELIRTIEGLFKKVSMKA
jgi:CheY-like chemotaxis protein